MITKKELKTFREDFANAVKGLEKKYNLSISLGGITYNDEKFTTRLTATDRNKIKTPEENFRINSAFYPKTISPDMYGTIFRAIDGKLYKLVGLNPKAKKNYCIVENFENKKQYVCTPEYLKLPGADYQKYERMIDYILNQSTEQTFLNFMGYDMRPVTREDVEEVISQMPEDVFDKLYMDFFPDTSHS